MQYFHAGASNIRTKWTHPYSYDPIVQFSRGEQGDATVYSDRLIGWYGYERVEALRKKHFGTSRDDYSEHSPERIEQFLREVLNKPSLELTKVEEHCNQATGYPCWRFDYLDNPQAS